jgi:hypothetical protein
MKIEKNLNLTLISVNNLEYKSENQINQEDRE